MRTQIIIPKTATPFTKKQSYEGQNIEQQSERSSFVVQTGNEPELEEDWLQCVVMRSRVTIDSEIQSPSIKDFALLRLTNLLVAYLLNCKTNILKAQDLYK